MLKNRKKHGYVLAKERILRMISGGNLRPGDLIPSRNSLSMELKIGGTSIQQAIRLLEKEGVLRTVRGSGCYVKDPSREAPVNRGGTVMAKSSSTDFISGFSLTPSKVVIRLGLLSGEMEDYGGHWRKILAEYERARGDVSIEIVETGFLKQQDLGGMLSRTDLDILQLPMSELPSAAGSGLLFNPSLAGSFAMDECDFFKALYEGSFHEGTAWGVPLTVNSSSLFCNSRCAELAGSLSSSKGFWGFLDTLVKFAGTGWLAKNGFEAFIANAEGLLGVFSKCPGSLRADDFASGGMISSHDFQEFIVRFEKYYRDRKIFHPDVCRISEHPFDNFMAGRSALSFGNTSWIPRFQSSRFFSWGVLPEAYECGGFTRLFGIINCISAYTYCHMECLDILNYLASFKVQESFAKLGRCVAHRKACSSLTVRNLDGQSKDTLLQSLETGRLIHNRDIFQNDFMHVASPTMLKWYSGAVSAEELCATLREKKDLFDGAVKLRMKAMAVRRAEPYITRSTV